eukprot:2027361-Ditylum_brightwellii.AAC.1
MGVAFTAFAFEDSIENGGEAVKLVCVCAQSHKAAQKLMCKYEIQENGSRKQIGAIIRRKGDTYLVDYNVTGSSH